MSSEQSDEAVGRLFRLKIVHTLSWLQWYCSDASKIARSTAEFIDRQWKSFPGFGCKQ